MSLFINYLGEKYINDGVFKVDKKSDIASAFGGEKTQGEIAVDTMISQATGMAKVGMGAAAIYTLYKLYKRWRKKKAEAKTAEEKQKADIKMKEIKQKIQAAKAKKK